MKLIFSFLLCAIVNLTATQAQVGIGTSSPKGALEIVSTDSGILIPRVSLTSLIVQAPIINPQSGALVESTLVYNTATAGTAPNNVVPGFYYWKGNKWIALAAGGTAPTPTDAWLLSGNTGTNTANDYIGTSDNVDLHFRAGGSNKFRMPFGTNQLLGFGGTSATPTYSWHAGTDSGMWLSNGNVRFSTGATTRFQIPNADQVHAFANGDASLPFYSWSNDTNMGIFRVTSDVLGFSTDGTSRFQIPKANQVHAMDRGTAALPFYSYSADTNTGAFSPGTDQYAISTNGVEKLRVMATGQVGIGTITPTGALDVTSSTNGFVAPRIALTGTNAASPVVNANGGGSPVAGTQVYNTATAGTTPTNVTPGYYYWDSAKWVRMAGGTAAASTDAWTLIGNAGTSATTNFIGTTDNIDFKIRTNNSERFNFTSNGRLRAFDNGTVALPTYSWNGDENTGIWRPAADNLGFSTNGLERFRILADGKVVVNGTAALTDGMFSSIATGSNSAVRVSSVDGNLFRGSATGIGNGVFADVVGSLNAAIAGGNTVGPAGVFAGQNMDFNFIQGSAAGFNGYLHGISTTFYTSGNGSSIICQDNDGYQWEFGGYDTIFGYYDVNSRLSSAGQNSSTSNKHYAFSVMGPGQVSTIVKDTDNKRVTMNSVMAPENLMQDYGQGQLANGQVIIQLDPNFAKNILVNENHVLKVFVQLEGECNGVYVTNKSGTSFEVKELANGNSNVKFSYTVIGVRADEVFTSAEGTKTSSYLGRFRPAPEAKRMELMSKGTEQ